MRVGPRWRRWGPFVLVLVVCALLLSGLAYALYGPSSPSGLPGGPSRPATKWVAIDGTDLIFTYTVGANDTSGYLSPTPECDLCPENITPGSLWNLTFPLTNNDSLRAHQITSVDIDAPFALVGSVPSLPCTIGPGASLTFTLTIRLPTATGEYFVAGSINAS